MGDVDAALPQDAAGDYDLRAQGTAQLGRAAVDASVHVDLSGCAIGQVVVGGKDLLRCIDPELLAAAYLHSYSVGATPLAPTTGTGRRHRCNRSRFQVERLVERFAGQWWPPLASMGQPFTRESGAPGGKRTHATNHCD